MNFSEAIIYENYLRSDFHTNTVIFTPVCLLVKMASKTVIRPNNRDVLPRRTMGSDKLRLPSVKLECTKKPFFYHGCVIFNQNF